MAKTPGKAQDHCFGPYRFDASKRLLYRDGELVGLSPKSLDVLAVLLEDRGEVVEKTDLLRRAWPNTTVEEVGLARNISLLRKEVGDWIETIPKKGYRFTSQPVEIVRQRPWWPWIAVLIALVWGYWQFFLPSEYLPKGKVALAVARIEVLDGPASESEKVREALVTELAKLDGVHVVSPTTTKRYEALHVPGSWMARLLGLEVLVEGTVMGGGKTTLRLIDVHTGRVIVANERLEDFVTGVRKSLKTK